MMLYPTLKLLRLGPPVIITSFDITAIVPKDLNVTVVTCCQFILQLFNSRWILTKEFTATEEVTSITVILMTFDAVKHKQGEHLIVEEATIIIMKQMLSPLFRTSLPALDVI